jgi:hypothetical protein
MTAKYRPVKTLAATALAVSTTLAVANQSDQQNAAPTGLVRDVRQATRNFHDVTVATAAGYVSAGSCESGPNEGAMGVHYVNDAFIADGKLDADRPEVLVYEQRNGQLRLVAVEFFVLAEQWDAANEGPPVLGSQLFNYAGAPNRLRLPAHYQLHVWAWKNNPKGMFVDWHPSVSCEEYTDEGQGHQSAH